MAISEVKQDDGVEIVEGGSSTAFAMVGFSARGLLKKR